MDNFDIYAIDMDGECVNQDFDDIDLYGEKLEDESNDTFGDELELN